MSSSSSSKHSSKAIKRIQKEIKTLETEPIEGVMFDYSENDISVVRVSIQGPKDTPYYCGFFEFEFKYPYNYPFEPMEVKFLTTDSGRVRFNPNLYNNGKVCLSIINTWDGPQWSPLFTISYVIRSIQTIVLVENPYFNEPLIRLSNTYEKSLDAYNIDVIYNTIRVALLKNIDKRNKISKFYDNYVKLFIDTYYEQSKKILMNIDLRKYQNKNKIIGGNDECVNETLISELLNSIDNMYVELINMLTEKVIKESIVENQKSTNLL